MPRVSVIVPNYNYGHFIGETIEHVLAQTFTDWEMIVVDDNSTDDSREVVRSWIARYPGRDITLIHHEHGPSGTPTPVNMGTARMRGEFFAWLSSDDLYDPAKLEEQVRAFDRRPELALVHTAYRAIDATGAITGSFFPPDRFESDALTTLLDGNFINGNTVLIRKSVLDETGPLVETDSEMPELWRAAEYFLWLKIAARHRIHCITDLLHRSRRHAGNAEFNGSGKGPALERVYIRRFLKEFSPAPTALRVMALANRGLWREAFEMLEALGKWDAAGRAAALADLEILERDQERWDVGDYRGIRRLDNSRIRAAFRAPQPAALAMLEAVAMLDTPHLQPYRAAAARRLEELDPRDDVEFRSESAAPSQEVSRETEACPPIPIPSMPLVSPPWAPWGTAGYAAGAEGVA